MLVKTLDVWGVKTIRMVSPLCLRPWAIRDSWWHSLRFNLSILSSQPSRDSPSHNSPKGGGSMDEKAKTGMSMIPVYTDYIQYIPVPQCHCHLWSLLVVVALAVSEKFRLFFWGNVQVAKAAAEVTPTTTKQQTQAGVKASKGAKAVQLRATTFEKPRAVARIGAGKMSWDAQDVTNF